MFSDDSVVFLEGSQNNLQVLKEILGVYEAASGQKINLQKSSIFFGKGCREEDKITLQQAIGINQKPSVRDILGCQQWLVDQRMGRSNMFGRRLKVKLQVGKDKDYQRRQERYL